MTSILFWGGANISSSSSSGLFVSGTLRTLMRIGAGGFYIFRSFLRIAWECYGVTGRVL